jgi:hypothetical protein
MAAASSSASAAARSAGTDWRRRSSSSRRTTSAPAGPLTTAAPRRDPAPRSAAPGRLHPFGPGAASQPPGSGTRPAPHAPAVATPRRPSRSLHPGPAPRRPPGRRSTPAATSCAATTRAWGGRWPSGCRAARSPAACTAPSTNWSRQRERRAPASPRRCRPAPEHPRAGPEEASRSGSATPPDPMSRLSTRRRRRRGPGRSCTRSRPRRGTPRWARSPRVCPACPGGRSA